jgi:hypothetical protein
MNTDKNFDIFKFLNVNMYSIMGKQQVQMQREESVKKARDLNILNIAKLGKINEHSRRDESRDDEFSINSDIDAVNSRIESDKAFLKLLMQPSPSPIKKLNGINGKSEMEAKFSKTGKIEKIEKIEKMVKFEKLNLNESDGKFDKSISSRLPQKKVRIKNLKSETIPLSEGRVLKLPRKSVSKGKKLVFTIESLNSSPGGNTYSNFNSSLNEKKKRIFTDHIGKHLVEHSPIQHRHTTTASATGINSIPTMQPLESPTSSPILIFNTMSQFSPQSNYQSYLNQSLPTAKTVTETKKSFSNLNKVFRSQMFQSFDSVKTNLEDIKSTLKSDINVTRKLIKRKIKKNNTVVKKPGEFESLGKIRKLEEETLFNKKGKKAIYDLKSHPQQVMADLMKSSDKINMLSYNTTYKFKDVMIKDYQKANQFVNKPGLADTVLQRKELDLKNITKNNLSIRKINLALLNRKKVL